MAVRNDNDLPELVPFEDRLPSRAGLFRSAEEMTDDQFMLLAAEWAEGESDADTNSEIESIFKVSPERRALAEDFKRIRLVPGNEKWQGREAMIKTIPSSFHIYRIVYAVLASAAVILVLMTLSPLLRNNVSQSSPAILPEAAITSSAISPSGRTVAATANSRVTVIQHPGTTITRAEKMQADAGHNPRTEPFELRNTPETVRLIAGISTTELTAVERMPVQPDIRSLPREAEDVNWIMRGITAMAGVVTGKDKPVDGYMIAGACVKGVNSVLGWDMDLERVVSEEGNPLAVNFSSSLLSFSAPVKKSTDKP